MFIISLIITNVFIGWALTEIGSEATIIEGGIYTPDEPEDEMGFFEWFLDTIFGRNDNVDDEGSVFDMLWNMATFSVEGIPKNIQILVFGTLNLCMSVALLFLLRGVG